MTEARLVTKEQLAAALHDNIPCKWGPHRGFLAKTHDEYHQWQADAIFAALPAAGPAEGLRREHKRNSGHDFDPKCGYCTMLAAAPAEGLREALNIPDTIPTTCHTHRLYDCWQCRPRIAIEAASDDDKRRAALARHESGSE